MSEDPKLRAVNFDEIGPQVGQRFPDVYLQDQHGNVIDLHDDRAGRRAIIDVHRSADW